MNTYNLFLASSTCLAAERNALEIEIGRLNDDFSKRNVHLQLHIWEKFDSANDPVRKQNFYNEHIAQADIFLVAYQKELGAFTREEYLQAQQLFVSQGYPRIYLFKNITPPGGEPRPENVQNLEDLESLWYARGKEQWPWEYSHLSELTKKVADDIRGLFHNPNYPHFSFPEVRKLSLNSPEMPEGFLGREEELKIIYQKLNSGGKLMLINAEGGIGKTTLAAKYWNEALNNYKHAAWLFCDSGIINSLKEIAPQLNIDLSGMDEQQQIQALKRGFHAVQNEFLLVLDNLNNEEDIRLFRQEFEGFHWHVLITSRCRGILDKEQELPIEHLPPPLAKELFERYYKEDTEEFSELLDRVLKAINYHTLLTEVFSKNLAEAAELGEMDLTTFLNRLENEGLFLREQSFEIENNEWATKRKAATTDQILDALYDFGQLTEDQRFLLVNMALLPAEPYTLPFINSLLVCNRDRTARHIRDRLKELIKKGWISEAERSYRLSPVIQKLVLEKHRDILHVDSMSLIEQLTELTGNNTYSGERIIDLTIAIHYINPVEHISSILTSNQSGEITDYNLYAEIANYNSHAGDYYRRVGDLINAKKMFINSQNIYNDLINKTQISDDYYLLVEAPELLFYKQRLADAYIQLAQIHIDLGEWKTAAVDYYKMAHELYEEILEYDEEEDLLTDLAYSYSNLAEIAASNNDLGLSFQLYEKSHQIFKELCETSPDDLYLEMDLAFSYGDKGDIYLRQGLYEDSLKNYKKYNHLSLQVYENRPVNIKFKITLANSYNKLGIFYEITEDLESALNNYQEYVRLNKEICESDPEDLIYKNSLAISYRNLGDIYNLKKDLDSALNNYLEFNRISKEIYVSSPTNIKYKNNLVSSYDKLGNIYQEIGNLENALNNYQESSNLIKDIYESNPEDLIYKNRMAVSYQNLANIYESIDDLENTYNYYIKLSILQSEIADVCPENQENNDWLANSYEKLGTLAESKTNWDIAIIYYKKLLQHFLYANLGNQNTIHKNTILASTYNKISKAYFSKTDWENALLYRTENISLWKDLVKRDNENWDYQYRLSISLAFEGRIFVEVQNWENALKSFQQYYDLAKKICHKKPDIVAFKRNVAFACEYLANHFLFLNDTSKYMEYAFEGLTTIIELCNKTEEKNLDYSIDFAISIYNLSNNIKDIFGEKIDTDWQSNLTEGRKEAFELLNIFYLQNELPETYFELYHDLDNPNWYTQ